MSFSREIAFDGNKIQVLYEHEEMHDLLDFMFLDLGSEGPVTDALPLVITKDEENAQWQLSNGERVLYNGPNPLDLGTTLMGEALFNLIRDNDHALAIHAGLVSREGKTILLPGNSGFGKSSITAWLLTQNWRYHTDELVCINLETRNIDAFTRPVNIKTRGIPAIEEIFDLQSVADQCRISTSVAMIPHRLLNPDFSTDIADITHIIFPRYIPDSAPELNKLPRAQAGLELMRNNVIARNLPDHGFSKVTALARDISAYQLHYQHFDDLPALINQLF